MSRFQTVMTPKTFSLYRRPNGREIALFGDDHGIKNGQDGTSISITKFIKKRLAENPNLHIYGEIGKGSSIYPESENKELERLRSLMKDKKHKNKDRIHDIDIRFRNRVISQDLFDDEDPESYVDVANRVSDYIEQTAPEIMPEFRSTEDYIEEELLPEATSEDLSVIKETYMRPLLDAEAVRIIRDNPDQAGDMLFYVGDAHRESIETNFLENHPEIAIPIHSSNATEDVPVSLN